MLNEFNPNLAENISAAPDAMPVQTCNFPVFTSGKHRKPKGKKAAKRALKKTEKERDLLLQDNARLGLENDCLRRSITLAVAVSRQRYNTEIGEHTLALLPPKSKR